jgi:flagellar biosynthesis anti-sigma factor FlgM
MEVRVKIRDDNGILRGGAADTRAIQASQADPARRNAPAGKASADRVELSDQARALFVAKEALSALPDVRRDRVELLRQAVKAGAYHVPAEKIAERMLADGLFA